MLNRNPLSLHVPEPDVRPGGEGRAYPLGRKNVDTDIIIAAEYRKAVTRKDMGAGAFAKLRCEPGNLFDDPAYAGARHCQSNGVAISPSG